MRLTTVLCLLLSLVMCSRSAAQSDSPLTITASGYYLTTIGSDGIPSYVQLQTVIDLRGNAPPKPEQSPVDLDLANHVKEWSLAVSDPQSAQAMASVYSHIRGALDDGTLTVETA